MYIYIFIYIYIYIYIYACVCVCVFLVFVFLHFCNFTTGEVNPKARYPALPACKTKGNRMPQSRNCAARHHGYKVEITKSRHPQNTYLKKNAYTIEAFIDKLAIELNNK